MDRINEVNGKVSVTRGMANSMSGLPSSGIECQNCGLKIGRYKGRYPLRCPSCDALLQTNKEENFYRRSKMTKAKEVINNVEEILSAPKGDSETTYKKVKVTNIKDGSLAKAFGLEVGQTFTIGKEDPNTTSLMDPNGVAVSLAAAKDVCDFEEV